MMLTHHSPEGTAPSIFQLRRLVVVSCSSSLGTWNTSSYISLLFYRYRRTSLGGHPLAFYSWSSARRRCICIHFVYGTLQLQCRGMLCWDISWVAPAAVSLKPGMAHESPAGAKMLGRGISAGCRPRVAPIEAIKTQAVPWISCHHGPF